jgi:hypothetical protein
MRLKTDVDSAQAAVGDRVDLELTQPLAVQGLVVAPAGTVAWGAVQAVNKGKSVKFDIQGMRLPDLTVVKLRSVSEKTNKAGKDLIKVEQSRVPRGSEFVAYVDDDASVEVALRPAPPAVAPAVPPPAPVKPAAAPTLPSAPTTPPVVTTASVPAEAKPTPPPAPAMEVPKPTPVAEPAATAAPPAAPVAPALAPAPTGLEGVTDWATVECFSSPSGADILIDGDFHGNTPSILKLAAGKHRIRISLTGYATFSQEVDLTAATSIRTIRAELDKKE